MSGFVEQPTHAQVQLPFMFRSWGGVAPWSNSKDSRGARNQQNCAIGLVL
jgi:hypothetical protein